jgi:branched-chain amino acid transport system ATP-binding protein
VTAAAPVLEVLGLDARYGGVHALRGVSLCVREREIVALIGANGAGKTTTLMSISQVLRPAAGSVRFLGREIVGTPPHAVVGAGLCQVPEGRRIFPRLTVRENLEMGAFLVTDRALILRRMDEAFAIFPILAERAEQLGGTLSGGEQQMLAIARALMLEPRVLLLDEPSLGLAPKVVVRIFEVIRSLRDRGIAVLLVEQNAHMALRTADRAYVLETGRITREGPAGELHDDPAIREAYLGA